MKNIEKIIQDEIDELEYMKNKPHLTEEEYIIFDAQIEVLERIQNIANGEFTIER